jgi:hypothetical protein
VNRLLHAPSKALRDVAGNEGEDADEAVRIVNRLFGLADENPGRDEAESGNDKE